MATKTNFEDLEREIEKARHEISAWIESATPGQDLTDAQLVNAVREWARIEYALQLQTEWNPSACVFESRWVHGNSVADWFERPFSAETTEQSQVLACAGLLAVMEPMYST